MTKILIVDDDTAGCRTLELHLRAQGHITATAHSVDQGLAAAAEFGSELIILDIRMPGRSGLDGLEDFRRIAPETGVIMITAFHDIESTIAAMQRGALDYIHKPIDIDELDQAIAKAVEQAGQDIALSASGPEVNGRAGMVERMSLAEVERIHVQRILDATGWHRGRACEILGVSRPRLRRLIRDHGLSVADDSVEAPLGDDGDDGSH